MRYKAIVTAALIATISPAIFADIPAPKEAQPMDWAYVLMGVICAFLGGLLLFVWLGRRLFKRPQ